MTWRWGAECRDQDAEFWFMDEDDSGLALSYCGRCPVRRECLAEALTEPRHRDYGIWGGTTRQQRLRMRRRVT